MKKYTYALFATVLALLSTACSSDADQQIEIYTPATVNITVPGTLTFEESVTSMDFEIKSTTSWTIKDLPKWLKASMSSGQNDQTITFTAELNPSCYNLRTDSFHVIAAELNRTVVVTQRPAAEYLVVYDASGKEAPDEFTSDGGSYSFTIDSNTSWLISVPDDWVVVSEELGEGTKQITLQVAGNPLEEPRSSQVSISSTISQISKTMNIRQAALVKPNPGQEDNPTPDL